MRKLSVLCSALAIASAAQAGVVVMDFTASGFEAGAPQDPVTGRLTWTSAAPGAPIDNFLSIDLTVAGYAYQMNEVGLARRIGEPNVYTVGGLVSDIDTIVAASGAIADFFLIFDITQPGWGTFSYISTVGERRIWTAGQLSTRFGDGNTPQPAPEPASLALLGLGLAGLFAARKTDRPKTMT